MPTYTIARYYANWDIDNVKGRINLYRQNPNGTLSYLYGRVTDNMEEFELITNLLRNEKPLFFVTESKTLATGKEPVGEEES